MAKFIKVTDLNDEKIIVNMDNVLWFKSGEMNSTIMYMVLVDKGNHPICLHIKESKETILSQIS